MVGLPQVVHVRRRVQGKFLVGVDIDHGPLAERALQPDANRAVGEFAGASRRFGVIVVVPFVIVVIVVAVIIIVVIAADQDSNVDLVVSLVHHDIAHPTIVTPKGDAKLELADAAFAETERMT